MSAFADLLRAERERQGLSLYALARKAGLSRQALSLLESGQREPAWNTVQVLAMALGVDCRTFADASITLPDATPAAPRGRPRKASSKATTAGQPGDGPEVASQTDRPAAAKPARRRKGGK